MLTLNKGLGAFQEFSRLDEPSEAVQVCLVLLFFFFPIFISFFFFFLTQFFFFFFLSFRRLIDTRNEAKTKCAR